MKWKQTLGIIALSATTALTTIWTYDRFSSRNSTAVNGVDANKLPVNYAGFL
jgi:hypothetical protein